jgi:hypothetical protein
MWDGQGPSRTVKPRKKKKKKRNSPVYFQEAIMKPKNVEYGKQTKEKYLLSTRNWLANLYESLILKHYSLGGYR